MSGRSPGVILYDAAGVALSVQNGVAVPVGTAALLVAGSDGTNSRFLRTATDGTLRIDPTGSTAQPISNANLDAALSTLAKESGGNLATLAAKDFATQTTLALIKAKTDNIPASPSQEHTAANSPSSVRLTDGTSFYKPTTPADTQPVSGPLTDSQLRATAVPISAAALPLPTGAATEVTLAARLSKSDFEGRINTFGQKNMAGSTPVVLPSDQDVTITGSVIVQPPSYGALEVGFAMGEVVLAINNVWRDVEATTYTEQTSGAQRSIASASANDTAAGTGARTVRITYYDSTGAGPLTEDLTLNGTTGVNTVATNICFVEDIAVLTAGSGGVNAGILSLYTAVNKGGSVFWSVALGEVQTKGCHHYVPTGRTCYITGFLSGIKGGDSHGVAIFARPIGVANAVETQLSDLMRVSTNGYNFRTYLSPLRVVGPVRLKAKVYPDSTSSRTYYASFDYYEK